MMKFKPGMYVEFFDYDENGNRVKRIGQWERDSGENSVILYFIQGNNKKAEMHTFRYQTDFLKRATIKDDIDGIVDGKVFHIVSKSRRYDTRGFATYYGTVNNGMWLIPEDKIRVDGSAFESDPIESFSEGNICPFDLFFDRMCIKRYLDMVSLVPEGFDNCYGNRLNLYEHQLDTVRKVLSNRLYRAILADEVGLGKTIEALVVLNYAINMNKIRNALIIVPNQLKYQWHHEVKSKFSMDVALFNYSNFFMGKTVHRAYIIGEADFIKYSPELIEKQWGMIICDEAHHAVKKNVFYSALYKLCKKTPHVLLLSATPILNRGNELFRLLKLYDPWYYAAMGIEEFTHLLSLREDTMKRAEEVSFGFEMNPDLDHIRGCIDVFRDIANSNQDEKLKLMLSAEQSDIETKTFVNRCFRYLDIRYELSPKYIRHRRSDILDESSKRVLTAKQFYEFSVVNDNEYKLYTTFREEVEEVLKAQAAKTNEIIALGNALFSSGAALNEMLVEKQLEKTFARTYKLTITQKKREENSFSNLRIETMVNYLKNTDCKKKIVIFTDFKKSAGLIYNRLQREFGTDSVLLFSGMVTDGKMQHYSNSFRRLAKCRFLVCDKLGSEGKNFQFANVIVHYDTPWYPDKLEQRIGRLDRIGRPINCPVENVVISSTDTIEEDMISMYENALNIYEESLSGIEIIFGQMMELIKNSIEHNALLGFSLISDEISELKEQCEECLGEEMFDQMLKEAEEGNENKNRDTIERIYGENYTNYVKAICDWYRKSGYPVIFHDDTKTYSFLSQKVGQGSKIKGFTPENKMDVEGTFDLETALKEEEVELLSTAHPLVRRIESHAVGYSDAKCGAVSIRDAGIQWTGFIFFWELDLSLRDYLGINSSTSVKNAYIDDSFIPIAISIEGDEMDAEDLLERISWAYEKSDVQTIALGQVATILDVLSVESFIDAKVSLSNRTLKDVFNLKINMDSLKKDIQKATEELNLAVIFNDKVKPRTQTLDELNNLKKAFDDIRGKMDSVLFVHFE